jgi:hypothetical protein
MKRLGTLIILLGTIGAFISGFVFWMANSSHQEAERLRRQGRHCDVEVVGKRTSSPGDGSSTFHYIDVKPLDRGDEARAISVSVVGNVYEQLHVGQRLKAWVLETDALLDYGPKNAAFVAQTMRLTCMVFGLVMVTGLAIRVLCRTTSLQRTPG